MNSGNNNYIDLENCEMTAEQIAEFAKRFVLFTENDHEAGMLRITIPLNTLSTLTKEQREKIIMVHVADIIRQSQ